MSFKALLPTTVRGWVTLLLIFWSVAPLTYAVMALSGNQGAMTAIALYLVVTFKAVFIGAFSFGLVWLFRQVRGN